MAFFAGWGMVLAAISIAAFGRDVVPLRERGAGAEDEMRREWNRFPGRSA
jgi:hypothetical protein